MTVPQSVDESRPQRLRLTSGISGITERELDVEFEDSTEWQRVDEPTPAAHFLAPAGDILGAWARFSGDESTLLMISGEPDGFLRVEFETGGHLGGWVLSRRGRYQDGVLELNLPVREYPPREYRRLYRVRILEKEYLVSSAACSELDRLESALREDPNHWLRDLIVFSKTVDG